jgi:hypothetical protein
MQFYIAQQLPLSYVDFKYIKKNYSGNFVWTLNADDIYYFDTEQDAQNVVIKERIKRPFIFSYDPTNGKYDKRKAYDRAMKGI